MNKFYFLAAAAVITLGACSQDNETPEKYEVGFNAITKKNAAKSIIENTTFPETEKFKVWGFADQNASGTTVVGSTTASNFMSGVEISKVGTTWKNASNSYYWPLTGKVGFYALYPSTIAPETPNKLSDGLTIKDYNITSTNSSSTGAVDLMYAYAESGRIATSLSMVFKHALSQVFFQFNTTALYSGATITINSVKLKNVDLTADFNFTTSSASWSDNTTQSSDFTYYGSAVTIPEASYGTTFTDYGNYTLMIPQALGDDQKAEVSFTIAQDASESLSYTMPIVLKSSSTNAWEMNKKYLYKISFKLDEILFNPSVASWANVVVLPETIE